MNTFYSLIIQYRRLILKSRVVARAKILLDIHPLRTLDAIQLASALEIQTALSQANVGRLIFVGSDSRLIAAAIAEGLTVINPETP